jgi:hypothetical protein
MLAGAGESNPVRDSLICWLIDGDVSIIALISASDILSAISGAGEYEASVPDCRAARRSDTHRGRRRHEEEGLIGGRHPSRQVRWTGSTANVKVGQDAVLWATCIIGAGCRDRLCNPKGSIESGDTALVQEKVSLECCHYLFVGKKGKSMAAGCRRSGIRAETC